MIDWKAIETEYITTDTSHRKLAQKYGIGRSRLSEKASEGDWKEKRDKYRAKTVSKAVSAIGNKQAERAARLQTVADKLLTRVERLLECDEAFLENVSVMKDISRVLKDLKDIQMIRSDADMREQEARIEKLRAEAQQHRNDGDDDETGVILMPPVLEVTDNG